MKKRQLKSYAVMFFVFLLWILCSLAVLIRFAGVVKGDGGLLSDQPCAAPCFYEVQIGDTALSKVEETLELSDLNLYCAKVEIEGNNLVNCGHFPFTHALSIGDLDRDEIVDYIRLHIEYDVTAGEAIQKFGNPDFVYSAKYPHMRQIYFIEESITLRFYVRGNDEDYSITENTLVDEIYYYKFPENSSRLVEWQGYGFYPPNE